MGVSVESGGYRNGHSRFGALDETMKNLAQYYVDLLVKLGIVRFSILPALALVALAVVVQGNYAGAERGAWMISISSARFFGLKIPLGGLFSFGGGRSTGRVSATIIQTRLKAERHALA